MGGLRLIFMGTPDFAVPSLAALAAAGHSVAAVYSQPPRPAGRGQKERPSPVHAWADAHGIEVRTPRSLRDPTEQRLFAELAADAAVVAAYGLILPKPILDAPRLGCFNVHASLLPRWRGAAPIQRAIMAGDAVSGVTIMRMEEGLDTGPMLLAHSLPITPLTTGGALHDALAAMGARLIVEALAGVVAGVLKAQPQPPEGVIYAAKLGKDDGRLDWRRPAEELARLVRALAPQPAAWFARGGERFKVLEAVPAEGQGRPGEVLDGRLTVACGSGALRLTRVQRAGKAAMDAEALLRGYALPAGSVLD